VHGTGAVQHQSAGGGADGSGQAQSLSSHLLAVKVRVVLIAAGGLLVAELQRLLEGGQGVQASVGHQRRGADRALRNHTSDKLLHISCLPS